MTEVILCASLDYERLERLMMATVVPRPTVYVTTLGGYLADELNIAPFSAVMAVSNSPPYMLLSINRRADGSRKRTADNILQTGEFVVNVLDSRHIPSAVHSVDSSLTPAERIAATGILPAMSRCVRPPRVSDCEAAIECKLMRHETVGDVEGGSDLFFGQVLCVWANRAVAEHIQGEPNDAPFAGVGSLAFGWYMSMEGLFRVPQVYTRSPTSPLNQIP